MLIIILFCFILLLIIAYTGELPFASIRCSPGREETYAESENFGLHKKVSDENQCDILSRSYIHHF